MTSIKSYIGLLAIVIIPAQLLGQVDTVWINRWTSPGAESDWAYAIALDDSGCAYVTGKTNNTSTYDDWTTIKYLPGGDTAWVRNFVGAGNANERASSITVGASGNAYLSGYTMSSNAGDYLTIKYRPNGDTAWTRRYNGTGNSYDFANWVCVDDQENVYVTGYSRGASYQNDIVTVKYDSNGTELWTARYNGPGNYNDEGFKVTTVGDFTYVVGTANPNSSGTLYDYVAIKYYSATGDTVWVRTYNGSADSSDIARDIEVDPSGNVYITGSSRSAGTLSDIVTIKYDSIGFVQWAVPYNNPDTSGNDGGYGLVIDSAGNVYVAGQSQGQGTGTDIVCIKYDSEGNQLWASRYNGPANDYDTPSDEDGGKCMTIDRYANVYITGCSRGAATLNDFITLAFAPDSTLEWAAVYNCCDSVDYALAVAVDDDGNVFTIGRSIGPGTYYDMAVVKYWSSIGIERLDDMQVRSPQLRICPNPFREKTCIGYRLLSDYENLTLTIYDISGQQVKNILRSTGCALRSAFFTWDATNNTGKRVPPGVYFCVLNAGTDRLTGKILLVR